MFQVVARRYNGHMSADEPGARFAAEVDARRKAMGRGVGWLEERSGIARSTVGRWRNGTVSPTAESVIPIADAIGMDRTTALQLAGLSPAIAVAEAGEPMALTRIHIDVLLAEIRRRILNADHTASEASD